MTGSDSRPRRPLRSCERVASPLPAARHREIPRWLRTLVLPLVLLLAWSGSALAANPHLERARRQLDDLKYEEAAASLEQALRTGESGPKELAEIYQLSGQVAAARGDAASAEDFFRHLLALAPSTRLPSGVSPKISEPFAAARAFIDQKLPIACRWEEDPTSSSVRVLVDADPLSMVDGAQVIWLEDGEEKKAEKRGAAPYTIPVPSKKKLAVRIAALDSFGNRIAEFGTARRPIVIDTSDRGEAVVVAPPDGSRPADEGGGRPFIAKWWLWAGVAGVAGAAGTYFGMDVLAAKDELEELNRRSMTEEIQYSEALAIEDRGKRSALVANISFGVAGAAAVAAVILFVTEPKGGGGKAKDAAVDDTDGSEAGLRPAFGAGHVGLVWSGSF